MTDTVDVEHATALLERLQPLLADEESAQRAQRAGAPALDDDEVTEDALRAALLRLGAVVSRQTFAYLRWNLEWARRATPPTPTPTPDTAATAGVWPVPLRRALADPRPTVEVEASALRVPRLMCDDAGARWVVSEVGAAGAAAPGGDGCLVFAKARERRRQPVYPTGWRSLPNDALSALLPPA